MGFAKVETIRLATVLLGYIDYRLLYSTLNEDICYPCHYLERIRQIKSTR